MVSASVSDHLSPPRRPKPICLASRFVSHSADAMSQFASAAAGAAARAEDVSAMAGPAEAKRPRASAIPLRATLGA